MQLSEKTVKFLDGYIKKLVLSQPSWLKKLFDEERIGFVMEDNAMLSLVMDTKLDDEVKEKARELVFKYMDTHPCKAIQGRNIFH